MEYESDKVSSTAMQTINGNSKDDTVTNKLRFAIPALLIVISGVAIAQDDRQANVQKVEFFETRIRPVLVEHCYDCHNSSGTDEGGLAVDHRQGLLKGSDNGKVVVPGKPDESHLLATLRHELPGLEMPQDGAKLDDQTIADFEKWIADGAVDPRNEPPSEAELAAATSWEAKLEARKQWWSLQPIQDHPFPKSVTRPGQPIRLIHSLRQNSTKQA